MNTRIDTSPHVTLFGASLPSHLLHPGQHIPCWDGYRDIFGLLHFRLGPGTSDGLRVLVIIERRFQDY